MFAPIAKTFQWIANAKIKKIQPKAHNKLLIKTPGAILGKGPRQ